MKTKTNQEILIEKEFSIAGVKLIQQFQVLLSFIKKNLVPVFCPDKSAENEKSLFRHVFDSIVNFGKQEERENKAKDEIIQNQKLIEDFRNLLKKFERMIRIFEMTYLDLKQKL